ncbi:MAG: hypothetical protein HONBIEJF_01804 [Fimbriimonadaceae bacterium]|nr:hypothetical protein [Fimbriimonadaceae bacterium]
MAHIALYRKYRSQTFGDLIGQEHVVRTLQNSIKQGKMAHAFLFTGPRGTGKTSSARLLAKALNCEKGPSPEPCNQCANCIEITEGRCLDVFEMDAASESGVDQIRESIVDVADYKPATCRFKIFIIDEVHDLSNKAFDALLKTIEEPPEHLVFILATTEFSKVPPTIRSRCQKFEFHRGTLQHLTERLQFVAAEEGIEADITALSAIARIADGGYRDALSLFEQVSITLEGRMTLDDVYEQLGLIGDDLVDDVIKAICNRDAALLLERLDEVVRRGRDPRSLLESLQYRLADLTRSAYQVAGNSHDAAAEAAMHAMAQFVGRERLLVLRGLVANAHRVIRDVTMPRIWLEGELLGWDLSPRTTTVAAEPKVEPAKAVIAPKVASPTAEPAPTPPAQKSSQKEHPERSIPRPAPTGDPQIDEFAEVWHVVASKIANESLTAFQRLAGSRVSEVASGKAKIELKRVSDVDWVNKRQALLDKIYEFLGEASATKILLEFTHQANGEASSFEPPAVDLPLEGEQLYDAARDVFGGNK